MILKRKNYYIATRIYILFNKRGEKQTTTKTEKKKKI